MKKYLRTGIFIVVAIAVLGVFPGTFEAKAEEVSVHPADINEDWQLVMSEAIAYLAGWQGGSNPMAYAIRAAYLWQNGEGYHYEAGESVPMCWVPVPVETEGEVEGEIIEGEAQQVAFCDFWPLTTGNMWYYTADIMDACCVRLTIMDQFSVNGYRIWEFKDEADNIAGTQTTYSYWVLVDGWFYVTSQRDDLNMLPDFTSNVQRTWPEYFTLGEPFLGLQEKTWVATLQNTDSLVLTEQSHQEISTIWTRNVGPVATQPMSLYVLTEYTIVGSCYSIEGEGEGETLEGEGELPMEGEPIEGETETILLPGNIPLEMVWIPGGTFQMGSPNTERSRDEDEGPLHSVTINYGFYMGKYEVTQAQWLAVMGSWPGTAPSSSFGVGDNYPAYYVSWDDAKNFITALNTHIKNTEQGAATFRLPTEAEWEYACRANTTTRFYFGDSLDVGDSCEDGDIRSQYMWYCGNNSLYGLKPVGGKLANAFGLHDMSGNVWEWCQDWWHLGYAPAPTDGSAWESPTGSDRVVRGGSWYDFARSSRSANRYDGSPGDRGAIFGFRLAR